MTWFLLWTVLTPVWAASTWPAVSFEFFPVLGFMSVSAGFYSSSTFLVDFEIISRIISVVVSFIDVLTLFTTSTCCSSFLFEVGVISLGTLSLVYILRVLGLLEEFGRFKMLLELFSIKTFYFYFYFHGEKIINIKTSPYILHNIL